MAEGNTAHDSSINAANYGLLGAVGAAVAASICCLGPLLLVALGVSGAWIGSLRTLEAYRPMLMLATASFLAFAFLRVYRPRQEACAAGSTCANLATKRLSKTSLWLATLLVIALLVSPNVIARLSSGSLDAASATTETTILRVTGMTCKACSATIRASLTRLQGVIDARVSFDPPQAIVEFDAARVTLGDLVEATAVVGYPSQVTE